MRITCILAFCLLAACQHRSLPPAMTSPYAGEESREIKALSPDEIQDLLDGAGMGYAKAAELNGYPGPRHVLDLADSLGLTADQQVRVESIFTAMQSEARALGRAYLAAEVELDQAFSKHNADREVVRALTDSAARIEGQIRATHLAAHLDMMAVLTPVQVATYNRLRGYANGATRPINHEHHH